MANNIICIIAGVFSNLENYLEDEHRQKAVSGIKRTISEDDNKDAIVDFLKKCRYFFRKFNKINILVSKYNEDKYILIPQKYEQCLINIGFTQESESYVYQAMGMLAISRGLLKLKQATTSFVLMDRCFCIEPENKSDQFVFVDWSTVKEFYEDYAVVKCNDSVYEIKYTEDIFRLYVYFLFSNNELYNYSKNSLNKILDLRSFNCVVENLIFAMENNIEKFNYLQLYQCLEYLFIVFVATEISEKHNIPKDKAVSIALDNHLRLTEEPTLEKIIRKYIKKEKLILLGKMYIKEANVAEDKVASIIAKKIYKIRCNIAHLKYQQDAFLSTLSWNLEFELLIQVTVLIYENINQVLIAIAEESGLWKTIL